MKNLRFIVGSFLTLGLVSLLTALTAPLGDLVRVLSLRENQLTGYGLVVGLSQTGDSRSTLAKSSLMKLLSSRGIELDPKQLESKNIAAVMVMAKMPAFARAGDKIDVWVSSIGDARSLEGGYLLQTPLYGADGKIYAVAQVGIASGQSNNQNNRSSQKKVATLHIPQGALIEKEIIQPITVTINNKKTVKLALHHFELQTAQNAIAAINKKFAGSANLASDGTISVALADSADVLQFITELFKTEVEVKSKAKVVLDAQNGTIVMGETVAIAPVSITKDGINIKIKGKQGDDDKIGNSSLLEEATDVKKLMNNLNQLGLPVKDIIEIIKAIHAAGALHAELIIL